MDKIAETKATLLEMKADPVKYQLTEKEIQDIDDYVEKSEALEEKLKEIGLTQLSSRERQELEKLQKDFGITFEHDQKVKAFLTGSQASDSGQLSKKYKAIHLAVNDPNSFYLDSEVDSKDKDNFVRLQKLFNADSFNLSNFSLEQLTEIQTLLSELNDSTIQFTSFLNIQLSEFVQDVAMDSISQNQVQVQDQEKLEVFLLRDYLTKDFSERSLRDIFDREENSVRIPEIFTLDSDLDSNVALEQRKELLLVAQHLLTSHVVESLTDDQKTELQTAVLTLMCNQFEQSTDEVINLTWNAMKETFSSESVEKQQGERSQTLATNMVTPENKQKVEAMVETLPLNNPEKQQLKDFISTGEIGEVFNFINSKMDLSSNANNLEVQKQFQTLANEVAKLSQPERFQDFLEQVKLEGDDVFITDPILLEQMQSIQKALLSSTSSPEAPSVEKSRLEDFLNTLTKGVSPKKVREAAEELEKLTPEERRDPNNVIQHLEPIVAHHLDTSEIGKMTTPSLRELELHQFFPEVDSNTPCGEVLFDLVQSKFLSDRSQNKAFSSTDVLDAFNNLKDLLQQQKLDPKNVIKFLEPIVLYHVQLGGTNETPSLRELELDQFFPDVPSNTPCGQVLFDLDQSLQRFSSEEHGMDAPVRNGSMIDEDDMGSLVHQDLNMPEQVSQDEDLPSPLQATVTINAHEFNILRLHKPQVYIEKLRALDDRIAGEEHSVFELDQRILEVIDDSDNLNELRENLKDKQITGKDFYRVLDLLTLDKDQKLNTLIDATLIGASSENESDFLRLLAAAAYDSKSSTLSVDELKVMRAKINTSIKENAKKGIEAMRRMEGSCSVIFDKLYKGYDVKQDLLHLMDIINGHKGEDIFKTALEREDNDIGALDINNLFSIMTECLETDIQAINADDEDTKNYYERIKEKLSSINDIYVADGSFQDKVDQIRQYDIGEGEGEGEGEGKLKRFVLEFFDSTDQFSFPDTRDGLNDMINKHLSTLSTDPESFVTLLNLEKSLLERTKYSKALRQDYAAALEQIQTVTHGDDLFGANLPASLDRFRQSQIRIENYSTEVGENSPDVVFGFVIRSPEHAAGYLAHLASQDDIEEPLLAVLMSPAPGLSGKSMITVISELAKQSSDGHVAVETFYDQVFKAIKTRQDETVSELKEDQKKWVYQTKSKPLDDAKKRQLDVTCIDWLLRHQSYLDSNERVSQKKALAVANGLLKADAFYYESHPGDALDELKSYSRATREFVLKGIMHGSSEVFGVDKSRTTYDRKVTALKTLTAFMTHYQQKIDDGDDLLFKDHDMMVQFMMLVETEYQNEDFFAVIKKAKLTSAFKRFMDADLLKNEGRALARYLESSGTSFKSTFQYLLRHHMDDKLDPARNESQYVAPLKQLSRGSSHVEDRHEGNTSQFLIELVCQLSKRANLDVNLNSSYSTLPSLMEELTTAPHSPYVWGELTSILKEKQCNDYQTESVRLCLIQQGIMDKNGLLIDKDFDSNSLRSVLDTILKNSYTTNLCIDYLKKTEFSKDDSSVDTLTDSQLLQDNGCLNSFGELNVYDFSERRSAIEKERRLHLFKHCIEGMDEVDKEELLKTFRERYGEDDFDIDDFITKIDSLLLTDEQKAAYLESIKLPYDRSDIPADFSQTLEKQAALNAQETQARQQGTEKDRKRFKAIFEGYPVVKNNKDIQQIIILTLREHGLLSNGFIDQDLSLTDDIIDEIEGRIANLKVGGVSLEREQLKTLFQQLKNSFPNYNNMHKDKVIRLLEASNGDILLTADDIGSRTEFSQFKTLIEDEALMVAILNDHRVYENDAILSKFVKSAKSTKDFDESFITLFVNPSLKDEARQVLIDKYCTNHLEGFEDLCFALNSKLNPIREDVKRKCCLGLKQFYDKDQCRITPTMMLNQDTKQSIDRIFSKEGISPLLNDDHRKSFQTTFSDSGIDKLDSRELQKFLTQNSSLTFDALFLMGDTIYGIDHQKFKQKIISVILERANQLDVSYAQVMFEMMLEAQKTNKTKIDPVHHLQEAVTLFSEGMQELPDTVVSKEAKEAHAKQTKEFMKQSAKEKYLQAFNFVEADQNKLELDFDEKEAFKIVCSSLQEKISQQGLTPELRKQFVDLVSKSNIWEKSHDTN